MKLKRTLLNFGAYLLALLILLFIFAAMMDIKQFSILLNFSFCEVLTAMFLSLGAYIGNGAEYYIMCRKMGIRMEKKDILLLPLAMNLAGTLLPVQGAMTYQIFLMKKKYGAEISMGCSIAAFLYILTITISGVTGIAIYLGGQTDSLLFFIISLVFTATPFLTFMMLKLIKYVRLPGKLERVIDFIRKTLEGIVLLFKDVKVTALLVIIYILRLFSMVWMFYWLADCLDMNIYWVALLLLNLWNMLSLLLKITPNNLGISQLVSGIMFGMINLPEKDGILLSFASTITFLLIAFTAGMAAMAYHFWQISIGSSGHKQ